MNVLFVTAELSPFSKVGGLAEFSCCIPKWLTRNKIRTTIVTPYYRQLKPGKHVIEPLKSLPSAPIRIGADTHEAQFFQAKLPVEQNADVIFVGSDAFFGRDGIYVDPARGVGFSDNPKRFGFFQLAVMALIEAGVMAPDLIHLNDHHTGLIPAMLTARSISLPTVLTLHNVEFQMQAEESLAWDLGIGEHLYQPNGPYPRDGHLNFLRAGCLTATRLVAVSRAYADETRDDPALSHGLSDILRTRGEDYFGITNGIDYEIWNPKTDDALVQNYSAANSVRKLKNKEFLLGRNGLDASNPDIPTIALISRLTDNKGIDLLASIFDKLMTFDLHMVMMGTGDPRYHKLFESIKMRFPHKLGLNLTYSKAKARQILAGSDFFFIPSYHEPSGQFPMYAMRYGAVPIVYPSGGRADVVENVNDDASEGNGFVYDSMDSTLLLKTIWRALSIYSDKRKYKKVLQRAMKADFSWEHTATAYHDLYTTLVR